MTTTIAAGSAGFARLGAQLDEIQAALRELDLDGWLLYDLHLRNAVAGRLLGQGDLTRRYFVLIPAEGEPVLVMHGIEEAPWQGWPWARRRYVGWRELDRVLGEVLGGRRRVAMEVSPGDAVPALDLVPAGVVELVQATGVQVVSSGDLITRFYARWSAEALAAHCRAGAVLAEVAREAFDRAAAAVRAGEDLTEGALRAWLLGQLAERGAGVGADSIVAVGANAADPHYATPDTGAPIREGELLLIDLWGKESDDVVFADQTWMGFLGAEIPDRVRPAWDAVRSARDAAVAFLQSAWREGRAVMGGEVDDVCRGVIVERGYGDAFIHRTGHSIDASVHGMGPNIDNLETHEVRHLIPGVGFSIEPGIYIAGDIGMRSEINVYMGEDGPEVTTPDPQVEIFTLLGP